MRLSRPLLGTALATCLLVPAGSGAATTTVATLAAPFPGGYTSGSHCADPLGHATATGAEGTTSGGTVSMALDAYSAGPAGLDTGCKAFGFARRGSSTGYRWSIPVPGHGIYTVAATFALGARRVEAERHTLPASFGSAWARVDARLDLAFWGCDPSGCPARVWASASRSVLDAYASGFPTSPPSRYAEESDVLRVEATLQSIYVGPENRIEVDLSLVGWASASGYTRSLVEIEATLQGLEVTREA